QKDGNLSCSGCSNPHTNRTKHMHNSTRENRLKNLLVSSQSLLRPIYTNIADITLNLAILSLNIAILFKAIFATTLMRYVVLFLIASIAFMFMIRGALYIHDYEFDHRNPSFILFQLSANK
ncbi:hypothetical protein PWB43_003658, partial [Acinetobacter baumannii]